MDTNQQNRNICQLLVFGARYEYVDDGKNNSASPLGARCLVKKVELDTGCPKLRFKDANREPPKNLTAKFTLRAYVFEENGSKSTAFNLSVTDPDFYGLDTCYKNLLNESQSAYRNITLNNDRSDNRELYVSCPFSGITYETLPYKLEYVVTGEGYKYGKRYIFIVPRYKNIDEGVKLKDYEPFVYIDVSYEPYFSLHVQPLPESYNVTQYRIWRINNDTDSVTNTVQLSASDDQEIMYDFTEHAGTFYFKVSAVHPDCGEDGCANSTTPCIVIRNTYNRLLIMIISTVWIPPVTLYVFYHLYKLYQKVKIKRERPKCLLVYSPSRLSHVNVMLRLAEYLKACHVNAMIDEPDITDTAGKDPKQWFDTAFRKADVVLVVTSPPVKKSAMSAYRSTDDHFLRLNKENISLKDKRYYIVHLPYCKVDDVPEETRHLRRFRLPEELRKLVKIIHEMERARCFPFASDKELLGSVKFAEREISREDASVSAEKLETGNQEGTTLPSRLISTSAISSDNATPRSYEIVLDNFDLLRENGEDERVRLCKSSTIRDNAFNINLLDL
nr:PREDICTED: uncharacterized protein LOC100878942 [Megachile rotundata]